MADDEQQIAWLALKKGTPVVASDGAELGTVTEVVADIQKDIFSGIAISSGILRNDRFVPAASVARLTTQAVHLDLTTAEAEALESYEG